MPPVAVVVGGPAGWGLWFVLGQPRLPSRQSGLLTTTNIYDGIKIALTVVAGIGGVIGLVGAFPRPRSAAREQAPEGTKLHTHPVSKGGDEVGFRKAAVRPAGG